MQFQLVVDITGAAAVAPYYNSDESFQVYTTIFGYVNLDHAQMVERVADKICKLSLVPLVDTDAAHMSVDLVRQCLVAAALDIRQSQSLEHEFMYTIDTHNGICMPTIKLMNGDISLTIEQVP